MIKKIAIIILLIFSTNTIFAASVEVKGIVRDPSNQYNYSPQISSIMPSYSPVVVKNYTIQSFSMHITDLDGNNVSFTITPSSGSVDIYSGILTNTTDLKNGNALIFFKYLAPKGVSGPTQITVTLNDGVNSVPTIKVLNLYTY